MEHLRKVSLLALLGVAVLASGQVLPKLQVSEWLQAPNGFTGNWDDLRGKVVVLEFWATWCEPCVKDIPHLNQVANEFRNESVVFLAITDDDVERLKPFLAKQPVEAFIGVDTEHKNWKPFAVSSLPHTLLIGKDGHILGRTVPEAITTEVMRAALADKNLTLPNKGIAPDISWDEHPLQSDGIPPLMYAVIKPIQTDGGMTKTLPGHFVADGVSLKSLVSYAYETDTRHLDWKIPEDGRRYRVAFRVPQGRNKELLAYMRETLAKTFGMQARWEEQEQEVYVLRRVTGQARLQESHADKPFMQMTHEKVIMRKQPIETLSGVLMDTFNAIVIDETGMDGPYDFDVPRRPEAVTEALSKIGLEAIKEHRSVRVLAVLPEQTMPENK